MNIALSGATGGFWSMTERGRGALRRTATELCIGPTCLAWSDGALRVDFDEIGAPIPRRRRGSVRLTPATVLDRTYDLDGEGRHLWRPIAPRSRVELSFEGGGGWSGDGYLDTNSGAEPIAEGFTAWTWSRAHLPDETVVSFDVERRRGGTAGMTLALDAEGNVAARTPREPASLPHSLFRVPRHVRPLGQESPTLVRTLVDAPFYARSLLRDRVDGEPADVVHETLLGDRLRHPLVRAMLPFRMPRALW